MKPSSVNVLGKTYEITYCDKPSDVDHRGRESLWGQIDYWTHSIRIYAPDSFSSDEIWDTILHEVLHGLAAELKIELKENEEKIISLLAMGLADVFIRNDWIRKEFTK